MAPLTITLDEKRRRIISEPGHLLVTGGPGSGKTTIALIKAKELIGTLMPGQEILFLSFSRAAVRQVLTRCKSILTRDERASIEVQTYHSFCLECLRTHGRLLAGKPVTFIYPDVERIQKGDYEGDWIEEAARRAKTDAVFGFDRFAEALADIFEGSSAARELIGRKYPMIIVDEFQDTDDDQWRMVAALSARTTIFCLADPDQSIFQYNLKVDPERLVKASAVLRPLAVDLSGENHRSPNSGILGFANAVMNNHPIPQPCPDVTQHRYPPKGFEGTVHASVVWMFSKLGKAGVEKPTIAVLCRSNQLVSDISVLLGQERQYRNALLKPISHEVVWDAELSAAAAVVLASVLEWPLDSHITALDRTLRLTAAYYRLKAATVTKNAAARDLVKKLGEASHAVQSGSRLKMKAAREIQTAVAEGVTFTGDPVNDWLKAVRLLGRLPVMAEIQRQVRLVRLFRATDALGQGLAESWLATAGYKGATVLVKKVLEQERLISAEQDPQGVMVMNIHKSKGKEFDGVIVVEGAFKSFFFDRTEKKPHPHSRRLLRVAITRARIYAALVRPNNAGPLYDP